MRSNPLAVTLPFLGAAALAQDARKEFPESMDFGPCMTTTFDGRGNSGFTVKGLVVRLGELGALAFDTELLRVSAAWTDGFLQLRGTAYDGAHGPMPALRGHKLCETRVGPGIAHEGRFDDPRSVPYGPLPREWGAYRGYSLHGDRVVIAYSIGDMAVREVDAMESKGEARALARSCEFGPCREDRWLVVADAPHDAPTAPVDGMLPLPELGAGTVAAKLLQWTPPAPGLVELSSSTTGWDRLTMGGPSGNDFLDQKSGTGATVRFVPRFARAHGSPAPVAGASDTDATLALPRLCDGAASAAPDDAAHGVWFDRKGDDDDGRFHVDLQRVVDVSRVNTFTWGRGDRSVQRYELFGSEAAVPPALDAADPAQAGWRAIARVDSGRLGQGDKHGVGIAKAGGLGNFRHLLFAVRNGGARFCELDVYADRFRATVDADERPPVRLAAVVKGDPGAAELKVDGARLLLRVPPHQQPVRLKLLVSGGAGLQLAAFRGLVQQSGGPEDPAALQQPAAGRWGAPLAVPGVRGADDDAFAVDTIAIPFDNRYGSRMRVCAFDFFKDGRAAITTWNGDVWLVSGLDGDLAHVTWQRYATGLFDPLGLKIVDDVVYVHGRDGITRLFDDNGDGEADRYECFNHDVTATPAFHEFAFDLQTDPEGNFYCSKAGPVNPGGRGFMKIAPHHGTIMKISKDGQRLEVIATGLRAPNGIGVSPDGRIVTSGDNEGTYIPRCRLNWITSPGFYAGVKDTAHRTPVPDTPDLPLCWMPMEIDNSSGGQVWVTSDRWGPLQGRLLHLSYGTSGVYLVLQEEAQGHVQGGVVRLPFELTSSAMRARFHPTDGQLYVAGFQGWQTNAAREGGFHRVRWTGKPLRVPVGLRTCSQGVYLTFLQPLDPKTATDVSSYGVEIWNYLYSQNYGSPELSILHPERKVEQGKPNRDPLPITSAKLSPDGRTVFLAVPAIQPVMQMKITYNVDAQDGAPMRGEVHNSIHALDAADPGFPAAH